MRTKLIIFSTMLLIAANINAQDQKTRLVFGVSIDPSMALWGPGHSYDDGDLDYLPGGNLYGERNPYPDISSSLDIEFSFSIEIEFCDNQGIRPRVAWQTHKAIGYDKLTFPGLDYMLKNHVLFWEVDGFNQFAGIEIGVIYRHHPDASYDQPNNYIKHKKSYTFGANVELQYNLNNHIGIGILSNWFRAENDLLIDGKQFRFETHAKVYYKL